MKEYGCECDSLSYCLLQIGQMNGTHAREAKEKIREHFDDEA